MDDSRVSGCGSVTRGAVEKTNAPACSFLGVDPLLPGLLLLAGS
jgi:hypothetical protein